MREYQDDFGRARFGPFEASNFRACLGWGHYAPSGVTVKLEIACL